MKSKIEEGGIDFQPVTLKIEMESLEELLVIRKIFGISVAVAKTLRKSTCEPLPESLTVPRIRGILECATKPLQVLAKEKGYIGND